MDMSYLPDEINESWGGGIIDSPAIFYRISGQDLMLGIANLHPEVDTFTPPGTQAFEVTLGRGEHLDQHICLLRECLVAQYLGQERLL